MFKKIDPTTKKISSPAVSDRPQRVPVTTAKTPTQDTSQQNNAIQARTKLIDAANVVIDELAKRANGQFYNDNINLSDQLRIMEYAIPIIQQSQDAIHLENLATQTPEERTNTILQAVATGKITTKNALELVNCMKALHELANPNAAEDTGKLIINLAPMPTTNEKAVN